MSTVRLFVDNNFGGRNLLIDNSGHVRYVLATFDFLNGLGFNDVTSSLQLRSSTPNIPSTCILFKDSRFSGDLVAFAFHANRDINALPTFNDVTSSVILVDHDPNPARTVLHLRQLAGNQLNDAADKQLKGDGGATRDGDVLAKFVIDLFEVSLFGIDLMLLEIPVKIHTPWPFSDYSAKIRYWIKLFINGSSQCRGFVAAWGYWIEGGLLTGSIEGRLRPKVQKGIGSLETQLNNMLTELDFHKWNDVYLLPAAGSVEADFSGNLDDDVTIVLDQAPGLE
jgi:hypothetical protein